MILAGWANNCGIELFNIGWVQCPTAVVPAVTATGPSGRGSGPTHGIRREGYNRHREDALRETRLNRILAEDEEIVAMIMMMLKNGLM